MSAYLSCFFISIRPSMSSFLLFSIISDFFLSDSRTLSLSMLIMLYAWLTVSLISMSISLVYIMDAAYISLAVLSACLSCLPRLFTFLSTNNGLGLLSLILDAASSASAIISSASCSASLIILLRLSVIS